MTLKTSDDFYIKPGIIVLLILDLLSVEMITIGTFCKTRNTLKWVQKNVCQSIKADLC